MITIQIELSTGIAKPTTSPVIKVGAAVPVTIQFFMNGTPSAPGTALTLLQLGLGTDATPPALLAYLETFSPQNSSTYTGFLNANDTRLVSYMSTLGATTLNCEVAWTADGELQVAPNFPVTVQPRVIPLSPTPAVGMTWPGENFVWTSPAGHTFGLDFADDGTITPVQLS